VNLEKETEACTNTKLQAFIGDATSTKANYTISAKNRKDFSDREPNLVAEAFQLAN
jgi:hypothetical protein